METCSMGDVIYEDSRQQIKPVDKHAQKHLWWRNHGVTVQRRKLDFGDYITDGSNVSVDTKRNMAEVAMDCGRDNRRFAREMDRARNAGYRLVILVETGTGIRCIDDVMRWTNDVCKRCQHYRAKSCDPLRDKCRRFRGKPTTGVTLARTMQTFEEHHGCIFAFVHPSAAARVICETLGVPYGR